jgi:hypothetical protein
VVETHFTVVIQALPDWPCYVLHSTCYVTCQFLQGSRPVIFFTRYGKNSIRMAVNSSTGPASAKAKAAEKKLKWGVKLRLDVNKPVVGLAAHPTASQLLVLFDDGSLRGYALTPNGLQMIWPAAFMLPGEHLNGVWLGSN